MQRPAFGLFLVVSSLACGCLAQDAPRITVANEDAHVPASADGSGSDPMQDLLNWGIQNSDPERLKELMQKYKDKNLTIKDVYGQDMIDAMFVNEGSVMKDMVVQIADFENQSVSDDNLEASLERLNELVEQVDNAGNLHRMGGLRPLLDLGLGHVRSEPVRALALWTLGVAAQNNHPVQADLMDMGGLPLLLGSLPLCTGSKANEEAAGHEYCGKLLFAISGLVKNNQTIQASADSQGLFDWLLDKGMEHPHLGIVKKSLALLDITLSQSPNLQFLSSLPAKQDVASTSLLAHIAGSDMDAAEKALRLVNRLLSLRPMLFRPSFRPELLEAVASAVKKCEHLHGPGDEICDALADLAKHADLALAARELSDDEL